MNVTVIWDGNPVLLLSDVGYALDTHALTISVDVCGEYRRWIFRTAPYLRLEYLVTLLKVYVHCTRHCRYGLWMFNAELI